MVLIKDDAIDAVLVASSDRDPRAVRPGRLAAGKPVLCEKPLAPDVDGCLRILAAESAAGRRLVSVGFMRRFDPGYGELKSRVERRRSRRAADDALHTPQRQSRRRSPRRR